MKKSKIGVALSLVAMINSVAIVPGPAADGTVSSPISVPSASSDPVAGSRAGDGVTNYSASSTPATTGSSSPKVDTEHWPWMDGEPSAAGSGSGSLKTETPKVDSGSVKGEPQKMGSTPMKMETPRIDSEKSIPPPAPLGSASLSREKPLTGTASESASTTQKKQPIRLFGRIEQIESRGVPQFPIVLKAQTAKMDTRGTHPMQANASEFSGRAVRSFPENYSGNWGGSLVMQQIQVDPRYYQIDPEEARRTLQALRLGSTGAVNFVFQNLGGSKVTLEPAQVMFMVAGKDTIAGDQVKQMMGQMGMGASPFGGMVSQMVQGMQVPVILSFGNVEAGGMETGVSGNQIAARVLKNDIRELSPGVLEEQIVAQKRTVNVHNNQPRTDYDETVLRFTQHGPSQMYVQAASVDYDASKHFLMKTVLAGWITRGQVMQTNPMAGMPGIMPGGMDLQKMMGPNGMSRPGQTPSIPGFDPNMLKNLFGQ